MNPSRTKWTKAKIAGVCRAAISGARWEEIATAHGLSRERIRQVAHKGFRICRYYAKKEAKPFPEHDWGIIADVRKNADFYTWALDKLEKEEA